MVVDPHRPDIGITAEFLEPQRRMLGVLAKERVGALRRGAGLPIQSAGSAKSQSLGVERLLVAIGKSEAHKFVESRTGVGGGDDPLPRCVPGGLGGLLEGAREFDDFGHILLGQSGADFDDLLSHGAHGVGAR